MLELRRPAWLVTADAAAGGGGSGGILRSSVVLILVPLPLAPLSRSSQPYILHIIQHYTII